MDRAPWFEIGAEAADKDTESDVNRKKALGERASRSLFGKEKDDETEEKAERTKRQKTEAADKEAQKTKSQEVKKPFKLFEFKAEKESKSNQKQTYENNADDLEAATVKATAVNALREQLPINIAKLETELATTNPDTPEFEAAEAALLVEKRLQEKAEDPTIEALPEIDAEFDRRIAEITVELMSETTPAIDMEASETDEPATPRFENLRAPRPLQKTTPTPVTSQESPEHSENQADAIAPIAVQNSSESTAGANERKASIPSGQIGGFVGAEAVAAPFRQRSENNESHTREKQQRASAFVSSGVLGYALGRRGEKRRSEARFNPRVETLQTEARKTKERLTSREAQLKKIVREQRPNSQQAAAETVPVPVTEQDVTSSVQSVKNEFFADKSARSAPSPEDTPSIRRLNQYETVSLPLQAAETDPVNIFERTSVNQEEQKQSPGKVAAHEIKQVEQLSTPQLLERASMLYISGTSVRELYTTNRIDRRGLISIVQESMRGRDIKATFEKVELGLERQRERAREFRHDDTALTTAPGSQMKILPVAKPLGHTVIQDVEATKHTVPHPPLNLPNTPQSKDLQPLQHSTGSDAPPPSTPSGHAEPHIPLEFKLAAIAGIAIISLVAWVILS